MTVKILKNNVSIKKFETTCTEDTLQKVFQKAFDTAGGMWNGKDEFTVIIDEN